MSLNRLTILSRLDRLGAIWSKPAGWRGDACAIAVVLAIGAVAAAAGAVHTRIFGHDIFVFLDAGWRVLNGQRPEIDFNPSMGPLLALLAAAGMKLARNSPDGIAYMSALVGGVVGLGAYALARARMALLPATLAAAALALIAVAPFPIGWPPNALSHAMLYNRYGYALLGFVLLECFLPGQRALAGGISTGIASVALLFLKPSYCLVALGFIAGSFIARANQRGRILGTATGSLAAGLTMMAYLRFGLFAFWSDLQLMSAARSAGLSGWSIRWAFFKGFADFLPLILLAVLAAIVTCSVEPLIVTALAWIGGALLLATNAQSSGYPLNAILALVLVEQGRRVMNNEAPGWKNFPRPTTILVLLGLACYLPATVNNASGLLYGLLESRRPVPKSVARFESPILANLILNEVQDGTDADQRSNGAVYVE